MLLPAAVGLGRQAAAAEARACFGPPHGRVGSPWCKNVRMATCLVALGSNLGDRAATLLAAVDQLRQVPSLDIEAVSRWHETPSIGGPSEQADYLNGVVRLRTTLDPVSLWNRLQQIEFQAGRQRSTRWGPRTLDLDLLLFGDQQFRTPQLILPHPRMSFRSFVLAPAVEIAADLCYPPNGKTLAQLWERLQAPLRYVAITGLPQSGQPELASLLCQQTGGHLLQLAPQRNHQAWQSAKEQLSESQLPDRVLRGEQVLISDYWLGEVTSEPNAAEIHPKLLISLNMQLQNRSFTRSVEKQASVQSALQWAIQHHGPGPLLELDSASADDWLDEAVAAVHAAG